MPDISARTAPSSTPRTDAQLLRDYLTDRDCPCPGCGYNLRMLQATCP